MEVIFFTVFWSPAIFKKVNRTFHPEYLECINVSASIWAIMHTQVNDMDWAYEENITITAHGKIIYRILPHMKIR